MDQSQTASTTDHIGIVACSYPGARLCYSTICEHGQKLIGRHAHPQITMHTYPLSDYMEYIETGDWEGVARLMLQSEKKLYDAGAEFAVCPDNTIHQAFDIVGQTSKLPWLHIATEVAAQAHSKGLQRLGLLGTTFLVHGPVYPPKLAEYDIECQLPTETQCERINDIIFDELVAGIITDDSREYFAGVIDHLRQNGCDGVILGCTEIPLIVTEDVSSLPTLDSTRILARAAVKRAVETDSNDTD